MEHVGNRIFFLRKSIWWPWKGPFDFRASKFAILILRSLIDESSISCHQISCKHRFLAQKILLHQLLDSRVHHRTWTSLELVTPDLPLRLRLVRGAFMRLGIWEEPTNQVARYMDNTKNRGENLIYEALESIRKNENYRFLEFTNTHGEGMGLLCKSLLHLKLFKCTNKFNQEIFKKIIQFGY